MKTQKIRSARGFTVVEAIIALVIISGSVLGILRAFSYGQFYLEKMGITRQALGLLQGEMEYWRMQNIQNPGAPLSTYAAASRKRSVTLENTQKITGVLEPAVSSPQNHGPLQYQNVTVRFYYASQPFSDTLQLHANLYLQ